jgi:hypothetical protein
MRATNWILGVAVCLCVSTGSLVQGEAYARVQPPLENLYQAKTLVLQVKSRIAFLIQKIAFGGGGRPDDNSCHRFLTKRKCMAAGCFWTGNTCLSSATPQPDDTYPDGSIEAVPGVQPDLPENDVAANFALQGMGAGLDLLAADIDHAALAFNQPDFWIYWGQACGRANGLLGANQAAKVSANIPPPGYVTAADFIPIDMELLQVKALLMCP